MAAQSVSRPLDPVDVVATCRVRTWQVTTRATSNGKTFVTRRPPLDLALAADSTDCSDPLGSADTIKTWRDMIWPVTGMPVSGGAEPRIAGCSLSCLNQCSLGAG